MIFSKSKSQGQSFTVVSVLSKVSAIVLSACLLATGCSKAEQPSTPVEADSEQQEVEQTVANQQVGEGQTTDQGADKVVSDKPPGKPVSYDLQNWEASTEQNLSVANLDQLLEQFGKVKVKDDKSLDYASNMAVKYRFMEGEEPYLDVIDSKDFIEFGWYYANPNDSDSEKKMSINHAKKVYKVMTGLMGQEGGDLVASILSRKIVKDKVIGEHTVELAKCEFYSCMIILNKDS